MGGSAGNVHVVAAAIGQELEHLAELQRILAVIDLWGVSVSQSGRIKRGEDTYDKETSYADDHAGLALGRGLRILGGDLVLHLLEWQGLFGRVRGETSSRRDKGRHAL